MIPLLKRTIGPIALIALLTPSPAACRVTKPRSPASLTGRWVGVEGMVLDVAPAGRDRYRLTMRYDLDHKGVFNGRASRDGIVFVRNGRRLTLRRTDGRTTGLKYLAGRTDCLTVRNGEGYCRR